jgi:disease resistance protein RPM1
MDPVTGAIGKLAPMLVDLLQDEYKLQKGVKVQIRSLALELESARVALSMLAELPEEEVDPQVMLWARHVRDASYDMADILDYCRARTGDGLFSLRKFRAQREIARAIEDIMKQLNEVTELRCKYALHNILGLELKPSRKNGRLLAGAGLVEYRVAEFQQITRQLGRAKQPVGKDMPDLESWMMAYDENRKVPGVLSLVGFGGVGKTTMAMALYRKLGPQFDRRAMVTVSQSPDIVMVLTNILSQVKGNRQGKGDMGTTLEKETQSVLSRVSLPSWNEAEDVMEVRQIRAELNKCLGQNRYRRPINSLLRLYTVY